VTIPEPSYVTAKEVKEQTLVTSLTDFATSDLNKLIQLAESQIDAYVCPQIHHPDDDNTSRVFPRRVDIDEDGNPEIPLQVSLACLRQVEWLYLQWWDNKDDQAMPTERDTQSESIGGDGSYSASYSQGMDRATICLQAKALLANFVSRTVGISVSL
jgi:hypothetical protein